MSEQVVIGVRGIRKGKKFINHVAITLPDLSRHICRTGDEKEREE